MDIEGSSAADGIDCWGLVLQEQSAGAGVVVADAKNVLGVSLRDLGEKAAEESVNAH